MSVSASHSQAAAVRPVPSTGRAGAPIAGLRVFARQPKTA